MAKFTLTAQLQLQAPTNIRQVVNQIQQQLSGVSVNISAVGSAQAVKSINQVATATNSATSAATKMGNAFGISLKRFAAFSLASRAIGLFTNKLSSAIDDAIDFQNEIVKLSQITGDSTDKLSKLADQIGNLAVNFGVSSKDIISVTNILAQAGLKARDLTVAIEVLTKTKLAPTFGDIKDTAEGAVAIIAQFGEGVGALDRQLGAINKVAAEFAVESEDLIDVVRRTGGVFKQSGGQLEELLALFTSVRATTRESAESISTGLRTIFTRIQRPDTIRFLKQFGVELTDLNGKFVGPYEAIKRLSEALSGLGEGDIRFIQIAEELGGFRQIGKVIPLLQQFTVAERARQVALNAGNSLNEDAAKAQESLLVQFTKVREEFLKLIRDISNTTSFKVLVKTTLGLASALIKVLDAVKPLIPLVASFAAIKFTQNIGGFFGGLGAAFGARKKSAGGKIHAFARGGLVPGSGNSDTVPAVLSPGEFVIRKSSVNKIGADRLAAMNENRYAAGGNVNKNRNFYGKIPTKFVSAAKRSIPTSEWRKLSQAEKESLAAKFQLEKAATSKGIEQKTNNTISGGTLNVPGGFGVSFLKGTTSSISASIRDIRKESNTTGRKVLDDAVLKAVKRKNSDKNIKTINDAYNYVDRGALLNTNGTPTYLQERGKKIFEDEIINGIPALFTRAAQSFKGSELDPKQVSTNELLSTSAIGSIEGQFFEAFVRRVTGNVIKDASKDEIFDFTNLSSPDLKLLFGSQPFVLPNEFKNDASSKSNIASAVGKALTLGQNPKLYASGGGISGSDTVPALLTPGEFVINKNAAQNIGYGNLNRMNQKGVTGFATGGAVGIQRFAKGGGVSGSGSSSVNTEASQEAFDALTVKSLAVVSALNGLSAMMQKADGTTSALGRIMASITELTNTVVVTVGIFSQLNKFAGFKKFFDGLNLVTDAMGRKRKLFGGPTEEQKLKATSLQADIDKIDIELQKYEKTIEEATFRIQQIGGMDSATDAEKQQIEDLTSAYFKAESAILETEKNIVDFGDQINKNNITFVELDKIINDLQAQIRATSSPQKRTELKTLQDEKRKQKDQLTSDNQQLEKRQKQAISNKTQQEQELTDIKNQIDKSNVKGLTTQNIEKTQAETKKQAAITSKEEKQKQLQGISSERGLLSQIFGKGPDTAFGKAGTQTQAGLQKLQQGIYNKFGSLNLKSGGGPSFGTGKMGTFSKGAANLAGKVAGKIPGIGNLASMGLNAVSKVLPGLGSALGGLTGGLGAAAGAIGAIAGPAAAVVGAFVLANKALGAFLNYEGQFNTAVESYAKMTDEQAMAAEGSAKSLENQRKNIEDLAILKEVPAWVGGLSELTGMKGLAEGWIDWMTLLGGNTAEYIKTNANLQAEQARYQEQYAKRAQKASDAMADVEAGTKSISEALPTIAANFTAASDLQKTTKQVVAANEQNKSTGALAVGRDVFSGFGLWGETSADKNRRIEKENADMTKKATEEQEKEFQNLRPTLNKMGTQVASTGGTFEDYKKKLIEAGIAQNLTEEQLKRVEQDYKNQSKAVQENIKFLKALNFGMRDINATAKATTLAMESLAASTETGYNAFDISLAQLEASLTEAATKMNPKDIEAAQKTLADTLRSYGADDAQVKRATDSLSGLSKAQIGAKSALEDVKNAANKGVTGDALKKTFTESLGKQLDAAGVDDVTRQRITDALGNLNLNDEATLQQIQSGNLDPLLEKAFGPLAEEMKKQLLGPLQERSKQEKILIEATRKRIELEKVAAESLKRAIDISLEADRAIQEFGGTVVTPQREKEAAAQQLNIGLGQAGVGGIRANATATDVVSATQEVQARFADLQAKQNQAIKTGGQGAFAGVAGLETDKRQQLQQAQQEILDYTKKRLDIARKEIALAEKKNELEKSAIDKLLGGDIEGYIKEQQSAAAGAALRMGDKSLAGMFGAGALGGAVKNLEEQQKMGGISKEDLYKAVSTATSSLGLGERAAGVYAGMTPEMRGIQEEARNLAEAQKQIGQNMAQMDMMQVEAQQVVINTQNIKMQGQKGTEATTSNLTQGTVAAPTPVVPFRFGGTVYANRGIFIPRGTDTVPAMLTPGEFVVRREAVQSGNNLQLLKAMNNGDSATANMAKGGRVGYYQRGGIATGINDDILNSLNNIFVGFADSVKRLQNMQLSVKLDATNINVNFNGTSFLNNLTDTIRSEVLSAVQREIPNIKTNNSGQSYRDTSTLA